MLVVATPAGGATPGQAYAGTRLAANQDGKEAPSTAVSGALYATRSTRTWILISARHVHALHMTFRDTYSIVLKECIKRFIVY